MDSEVLVFSGSTPDSVQVRKGLNKQMQLNCFFSFLKKMQGWSTTEYSGAKQNVVAVFLRWQNRVFLVVRVCVGWKRADSYYFPPAQHGSLAVLASS